jgi:spoIIIJ-associated protein
MEFIRVTAKTVQEAITEASIQLGTSSDNIEYHVIEEGKSGIFLGIGSKPAVIEARKKEESDIDLEFEEIVKEPILKQEVKPEVKQEVKAKKPAPEKKKQQPKQSKPVKTQKQPPKPQVKTVSEEPVKPQEPVQNKESVKEPVKEVVKRAPADKDEVIARVKAFLDETFQAMGIKAEIKAEFESDDTLSIDLAGEEMGILIGKRGRTLDSLQYLTSLVANKGNYAYIRVKLDTEDYRRRRKETLENLANNIAIKVKRTRKTVFLEPMNPYERRIIHSALQNNPYVSTHSEGEEPYRKVVVTLKKQDRDRQ